MVVTCSPRHNLARSTASPPRHRSSSTLSATDIVFSMASSSSASVDAMRFGLERHDLGIALGSPRSLLERVVLGALADHAQLVRGDAPASTNLSIGGVLARCRHAFSCSPGWSKGGIPMPPGGPQQVTIAFSLSADLACKTLVGTTLRARYLEKSLAHCCSGSRSIDRWSSPAQSGWASEWFRASSFELATSKRFGRSIRMATR
jgi:hypothetical protein